LPREMNLYLRADSYVQSGFLRKILPRLYARQEGIASRSLAAKDRDDSNLRRLSLGPRPSTKIRYSSR